jgi:capsule polysaccharide export protein KpsE/RkpR
MRELAPQRQVEDVNGHVVPEMEEFGSIEAPDKSIERLRLLWSERLFLRKTLAAGLVAGVVIAFLIPKHFQSTAQLMPPDSGDSSPAMAMVGALVSGGSGGGLAALASNLLGLKNSSAIFIGIMRSYTVQERIVDRFDLQKVYGRKFKEEACKELEDNTGLSEDRKSGIISIEVTDKDPNRAAAIAGAYIEELNRLAAEVSTSAAHRERVFLEERLREVKRDLNTAATKFSIFASKNTTIDIDAQAKAMVEAAATVQGELIAAESELKGFEQIYTANNVRIRALKSRIAELQAQLVKLGGTPSLGQGASPQGESLYPSIRQLPLLGVTYFDLYREAKIQEAVYEALTQQFEMAKVQEAKETPSVKVLDKANLPEKKSFPPRMLIIFLTTCLTFVGGVFWVHLRAHWERTEPDHPGKLLAQEVYRTVNAHMPWSTPNGSRLHAFVHTAWVRVARRPGANESREG